MSVSRSTGTSGRIRGSSIAAAGALVAALLAGCNEPPADSAAAGDDLGQVDFQVSCDPEVQPRVDRAVALLHHMMYVQARSEFESIAEADPECAMAHWGIAMTLFQPLWATRPGPDELEAGRSAVERARSLGELSDRERAYIDAVDAFFSDPGADYATRLRRFDEAMGELHRSHPDDPDAAAFYALARLGTAPQADEAMARQREAAEILAAVHERVPEHPGGLHYSIHAHDVEGLAEHGVGFAHDYDDIAPTVPHALHMPTHVFVRLGDWEEVIYWNRQSADAALNFPAGSFISHHYPHAMDYLMYAHLQRAQDERAAAVLEEVRSKDDYQRTFISAYALAAMPARRAVERRDWAEAAGLPVRDPETFPWDRFPHAEAMTHFARGLGAARTGDLGGAREALEGLETLKGETVEMGDNYWARQVEVQRLAVAAWLALAEGDSDEAVRSMRESAELASSMEKHPVTPGALQPAHELLADLLLELDRSEEALTAYERSLETWPNRFNSLVGAARAAERLGDQAKASSYYSQLLELVGEDADRPEIERARQSLDREQGRTET